MERPSLYQNQSLRNNAPKRGCIQFDHAVKRSFAQWNMHNLAAKISRDKLWLENIKKSGGFKKKVELEFDLKAPAFHTLLTALETLLGKP